MATITSAGVGSGLDLETLIENIVDAERAPVETRLDLQEARIEAEISAFGSLQATLAAFQDSLQKLKDPSFFTDRGVTVSNNSLISVSADSSADLSSYNIEVFEQAKANKIASGTDFVSPSATVGSGTLSIGFVGGGSFDIDVEAGDSLADIRDAINSASDNPGLTASLLTVDAGMGDGSTVTKFVLTADESGAANQITIAVSDDDGNNTDGTGLSQFFYDGSDPLAAGNQFSQVTAAQDARIAVDGFTAYSSTNVFDDVIDGVSITLLDEAEDIMDPPSSSLIISEDKSAATAAIETFVATYNELVTVFNALTNYDSATETSGLLSGDATVNSLESRIRSAFTDVVDGASGDFSILAQLGITTNRDGSVALNSDTLTQAINSNYEDVATLFSSEDGVANRIDDVLESYLQTGGILDTRNETYQTTLRSIESSRDDLQYRLEIIEERYRSQFAALDILVQQLNETGNFLSQQLSAVASIVTGQNES